MPNLRAQGVFAAVRVQLAIASLAAFRVVEWSVQFDHLHLIVEADDERALSRGMARLNGAVARAVNAVARRKGRAVRERYHALALRSPLEVRNAIRYVLNNGYKHKVVDSGVDPMSSGPMFEGWREAHLSSCKRDGSACAPRTWLLRVAWRQHGLIPLGPC